MNLQSKQFGDLQFAEPSTVPLALFTISRVQGIFSLQRIGSLKTLAEEMKTPSGTLILQVWAWAPPIWLKSATVMQKSLETLRIATSRSNLEPQHRKLGYALTGSKKNGWAHFRHRFAPGTDTKSEGQANQHSFIQIQALPLLCHM